MRNWPTATLLGWSWFGAAHDYRICLATSDPGWWPGRCGKTIISRTIAARIAAVAKGRLKARPPWFIGLSRKSPTVAPNGRVRMKAAQNRKTREILLQ